MTNPVNQRKNKVLHSCNLTGNDILVKYETPEGDIKVDKFNVYWYFAILRSDVDKVKSLLKDTTYPVNIELDDKYPLFAKVSYNNPTDQNAKYKLVLYLESKGIDTFEGDLLPDRRWYIDNSVEIADNYKKLYFDIETDDTNERIEIGRDRILSWSAIDDQGKEYYYVIEDLTDKSEKKLLEKFLKLIVKYDILLGWNSKGFDIPYLKERMRKYDLHKTDLYQWKTVANFDLLKRFRHIFRFDSHLRSFSLGFISQHFLGKTKVPHSEKIIDLWKNNQEKLKRYNIEDSILVKELDEKLGVSKMMVRQSQWCGVPPGQFGLYSIIDAHIIRTAHRMGRFCRTAVKAIEERHNLNERGNENPNNTSNDKAKYSGAIVLDPVIGKYGEVYVFDFKGLYPSMMRTSNIGYDTLRNEADDDLIRNPGTTEVPRKVGGLVPTYFQKEPSVINVAISELITKRSEYKKLKLKMIEEGTNNGPDWERVVSDEIIVKELSNSTYGIMGLEYGRYFSIDVAESITLFGQWCILFAKKFFEDQGLKVIYGDTDSVFVSTEGQPFDERDQLDKFHAHLKSVLKEKYNIDEVFIELEFDKKYESLILIEKKTYVGRVSNIEGKKTNELYARGLEFHKKNTFSFAAKKQKELIEYLLDQNPSRGDLKTFLRSIKSDFDDREFIKEELTLTQKVGKGLVDYSKTPPVHVRIAQRIQDKTGEILTNTEIEYIITRQKPLLDGIPANEFTGEYDKDYYWENKTKPILQRITEVIFPNYDFYDNQLTLFDYV